MQESVRLHDVQELLSHNLVNTVRSQTRVTKDMVSLIDVIITNKDSIGELATVMDLGYLYHKAEIRGGADKSLVRPGRKQDTATKLGIYSTCSP